MNTEIDAFKGQPGSNDLEMRPTMMMISCIYPAGRVYRALGSWVWFRLGEIVCVSPKNVSIGHQDCWTISTNSGRAILLKYV